MLLWNEGLGRRWRLIIVLIIRVLAEILLWTLLMVLVALIRADIHVRPFVAVRSPSTERATLVLASTTFV